MTKPRIIGFPQSTYVWTARAALAFKGVDYDFQPIMPPQNREPEHLARHPWGKVPVFEDGDVQLYETTAICAYVDAAFEGPGLALSEPLALARDHYFVSVTNAYLYPTSVPRFMLQYIFPSGPEGKPDMATIDAAKPEIRKVLEVLDGEAAEGGWLVGGEGPTLADLFVGPLLFGLTGFPGGKELLEGLPKLGALMAKLSDEPKFMGAAPARG